MMGLKAGAAAKAPSASKYTTSFELRFERYAQQSVCATATDSSVSFGAAVLWERMVLKASSSSSSSSSMTSPSSSSVSSSSLSSSSSSSSSPSSSSSSLSLLSPAAALAAATATASFTAPPPAGFGLPPALVQWLIDTPFEVQKTDDELVAEAELEAAAIKQANAAAAGTRKKIALVPLLPGQAAAVEPPTTVEGILGTRLDRGQ
jgi:hypothetical protein